MEFAGAHSAQAHRDCCPTDCHGDVARLRLRTQPAHHMVGGLGVWLCGQEVWSREVIFLFYLRPGNVTWDSFDPNLVGTFKIYIFILSKTWDNLTPKNTRNLSDISPQDAVSLKESSLTEQEKARISTLAFRVTAKHAFDIVILEADQIGSGVKTDEDELKSLSSGNLLSNNKNIVHF